jgi:hypothetical protein
MDTVTKGDGQGIGGDILDVLIIGSGVSGKKVSWKEPSVIQSLMISIP